MKFHLALALAFCSKIALAACPPQQFTDPAQVRLNSDSVLIVTHASSVYDSLRSSKRGIDAATAFARKNGIPIVYLQDTTAEQAHFASDCNPDYRVYSKNGEINFEVKATKVYVAGGHLERCLYMTVEGVLNSWARQAVKNRSVTYIMDGIYSNGEFVQAEDPFNKQFTQFTRKLALQNPDVEPLPRFSLLESIRVINQRESEMDYLARSLPEYGAFLSPEYQVEMKLNNSESKELQEGFVENSPVLQFSFVDSAGILDAM